MANEREFVIYISSTVDDLTEERATALRIASMHGRVVMTRGADIAPVVQKCIDDVRGCDVYVGIVGLRYGWPPPIPSNAELKSITEMEYDACGETIPRLVFVKERRSIKAVSPFMDDALAPVLAFRKRVQEGIAHTAFPFDDDDKENEQQHFSLKLDQALAAAKVEFKRLWSDSGGAMGGGGRPRKDLLRAVALVGVTGDDDAIERARQVDDPGFACTSLPLNKPEWEVELDRCLRAGQSACLLIGPAGLDRLIAEKEAALAAVLADAKLCARPIFLALAGVAPDKPPGSWSDGVPIEVKALPWSAQDAQAVLGSVIRAIDNREPRLEPIGNADLDALRQRLYAMATLRSPLQKVALPIVIATPDRAEISALLEAGRPAFEGYPDKSVRRFRKDELARLERALKRADPGWADRSYADERLLARCFGPRHPPALELVLDAIRNINEAGIGTRERRLLQRMRIVPRLYRFDDLIGGDKARSATVLDAALAGALVVIDELSLLHPRLLSAVEPLLDQPRTAAVSIGASDPTHSDTDQLLNKLSFLNVGEFLRRFVTERDPRCEVAVNSVQRLERWIRMVIPEMLALGDAGEASRDLVRKSTQMLGPTAGLP